MLRIVRVLLIPVFPEKSGNERIFLDLIIKPDGSASEKFPTFGFRGDGWPKPTPQPTIRPFILYSDGRMDFGDDSDDPWETDEERFSEIDIFQRNRKIVANEFVCVIDEGQEEEFKIAQVTELGRVT